MSLKGPSCATKKRFVVSSPGGGRLFAWWCVNILPLLFTRIILLWKSTITRRAALALPSVGAKWRQTCALPRSACYFTFCLYKTADWAGIYCHIVYRLPRLGYLSVCLLIFTLLLSISYIFSCLSHDMFCLRHLI